MKKIILIVSIVLIVGLLASCSAPAPAAEANAYRPPTTDEGSATEEALPADILPEENAPEAAKEPAEDDPEAMFDSAVAAQGESYIPIDENTVCPTNTDSLVTFSLKVDTAAYSNVARYIQSGQLPPTDAVKIEELINYFNYDTPMQFGNDPLAIYTEVGKSPFDPSKYIAFIRVKAKNIDKEKLPPSNLTFLIDTSGSMDSYDKLPLLKKAFGMLTENLSADDRISIVTYAGNAAILLDGATGSDQARIMSAINNLEAGGSTAGAEGIWTAYQLAQANYIPNGNNRVILATDGDFNVGMSDVEALSDFISTQRSSNVYLSALGFGTDNLQDDIMETLAKDGNGNYNYINSIATAKKVLVDELDSNLFTIANDVKAQVEFNPENVESYRLIGYENRQLENKDFSNDKKDAGEIGMDTDVVMLFELDLKNANSDDLKYSISETPTQTSFDEYGNELFEVRIRYKNPGSTESQLILQPVTFDHIAPSTSSDFNFAYSVAEFGKQLRESHYASPASIDDIIQLTRQNLGADHGGYRAAHLSLLQQYKELLG